MAQVGEGPEPAPEYHPHPDVPPDDLSERDAAAAPAPSVARDAQAGAGAELPPCQSLPQPPPAPPPAAPRILSGPPITNYIPPEIVMRPVRTRASCFRVCFERALRRNPDEAGRVTVRFIVDLDGWVRTARVEKDEVGDAELAGCLTRQFVGLRYPEPDGGRVTVIYPLELAPAGTQER